MKKIHTEKMRLINRIKRNFPVHYIMCDCCDRKISCPKCSQTELLRGLSSKNRTFALCYYCGTIFYCDNDEIIARLTDDRNFWGSEALCFIDLPSNIINESVNYEDLTFEVMEILEKYRDNTVYIIDDLSNNEYDEFHVLVEHGEFHALVERDEFNNSLRENLANSSILNILIKTSCEHDIIEIRSILIEDGEFFAFQLPN